MIKVQVSPYISISEWEDPYTGLTFSKKAGFIEIQDGLDLTGVKKHIRLNQLIIVGGDLVEYKEVKKSEQARAVEKVEVEKKPKVIDSDNRESEKEMIKVEFEAEVVGFVEEVVEEKPLSKMTAAELRNKAKEMGISGYSNMKKSELLKAIKSA